MPAQEVDRALASLRAWLDQRLTTAKAVDALQPLYHLCAQKGQDNADLAGQMRAYAGRIAELPAPAVLRALAGWPSRSKWFPTWAELLDAIDECAVPVRMQVDALMRAKGGAAVPQIEQRKRARWEDLTDEERAERRAHTQRVKERFKQQQAQLSEALSESGIFSTLSPEQQARIDKAQAEAKAKRDAEGSAVLKREIEKRRPLAYSEAAE